MAIFEDTRELSRQQRHVGMDKMKGGRRALAATMGYKDTGEKNWWGKIGGPEAIGAVGGFIIGGPAGAVVGQQAMDAATRVVATQASKGSDANQVFKETHDEWGAAALSKLKFGAEAASMALNLPGSKGGEGAKKAFLASQGAPTDGDIASSTAGKNLTNEIAKQGTQDTIDSTTSNVDKMLEGKTDAEVLNEVGEDLEELDFIKTDDKGEYILHEDGTKTYTNDLMEQDKRILKQKERRRRKEKRQEGLEKTVDLLGNTPLLGSGLDVVAKNRATTLAAEQEADIYKNKAASEPQFNLL
jgi:hypothetical protein